MNAVPVGFSTWSNPGTPTTENPAFEFPSFAPDSRIAKLGRSLTSLSILSAEPEEIPSEDIPASSKSQTRIKPLEPETEKKDLVSSLVSGSEVLCPFCQKPLPASILASHSHGVPSSTNLLAALPVDPPKPAVPVATSESLFGDVQSGDQANISAANELVASADIERWSRIAGIPLSTKPAVNDTSSSSKVETSIPLLPPPPGNKVKTGSVGSTGRFGFGFRRGSSNPVEDEESEDESGPSGYSRLDGPASPGEDEDDEEDDDAGYDAVRMKKKRPTSVKLDENVEKIPNQTAAVPAISIPDEVAKEEKPGNNEEIRQVLKEVVGRVNQLSTSHSDLLNSHSTLLTSLKIARSNLAMAEANAEMLEDEIRRSKAASNRIVSGPANMRSPTTPAPGLQRAVSSVGTTSRMSSEQSRPVPRMSTGDVKRPQSIAIPASSLFPAPNSAGGSTSSAEPTKSVFGFWNGGKKKLPGGLGSVHIPSAAQVMAALPSTRPGTPTGEGRMHWGSPPAETNVKSPPYNHKPTVEAPGLIRSASYSTLPTSPANSNTTPGAGGTARPTSNLRDDGSGTTTRSPPTTSSELYQLRQAYSSAVAKMSTMSTELDNLKQGKIEMEAELEGLSQALFEEANKMVADERKKRLEVEEGLKEVVSEREALKKVVEVLGGNTEIPLPKSEIKEVIPKTPAEEFTPRDLDKHYQALRETIHHVGDSTPSPSRRTPLHSPGRPTFSTSNSVASNLASPSSPTKSSNIPAALAPSSHIAINPEFQNLNTEPNPWAFPQPDTLLPPVDLNLEGSKPDISGEGELPTDRVEDGMKGVELVLGERDGGVERQRVGSPAVQDLDRLMERLQADMEGDV